MKQQISLSQWQELSSDEQEFITIWKQRKYPNAPNLLSIGECIELLIATTYNFRNENSDGRFFMNILSNAESVIGWEGAELIDILFYEVIQSIKRRLSLGTFNDSNFTS